MTPATLGGKQCPFIRQEPSSLLPAHASPADAYMLVLRRSTLSCLVDILTAVLARMEVERQRRATTSRSSQPSWSRLAHGYLSQAGYEGVLRTMARIRGENCFVAIAPSSTQRGWISLARQYPFSPHQHNASSFESASEEPADHGRRFRSAPPAIEDAQDGHRVFPFCLAQTFSPWWLL